MYPAAHAVSAGLLRHIVNFITADIDAFALNRQTDMREKFGKRLALFFIKTSAGIPPIFILIIPLILTGRFFAFFLIFFTFAATVLFHLCISWLYIF